MTSEPLLQPLECGGEAGSGAGRTPWLLESADEARENSDAPFASAAGQNIDDPAMLISWQMFNLVVTNICHWMAKRLELLDILLTPEGRGNPGCPVSAADRVPWRIAALGRLCGRLAARDTSQCDFPLFVQDICHDVHQSYEAAHCQLLICVDDMVPSEVQQLTLCLIVIELLSNCLEHAFEGVASPVAIVILRREISGRLSLMVCDNGRGCTSSGGGSRGSGSGTRLVECLAAASGGRVCRPEAVIGYCTQVVWKKAWAPAPTGSSAP